MYNKEVFTKYDYTLNYAIEYPENFSENKKYPVLFFFHGMGEVPGTVDDVIKMCPLKRERLNEDMPFIFVAPACGQDYTWFQNFNYVIDFMKDIIARDYVDEDRVYLSGNSMGGYAAWTMAFVHPELFAAAVICSGGGLYAGVRDRIKFPVRAIHGTADTTVLFRESEMMVERINRAGGQAELIPMEGYDHDVWHDYFDRTETYEWLASHKREKTEN